MIRPPTIAKLIKDLPDERDETMDRLLRYIIKLENDIKVYENINYKQNRLDLIAVNETIQEKNKLIEELTNLLEPKEQ